MPNPLAITLHASGAESVSGTGTSVDLGDRTLAQLTLEVTALGSGSSVVVSVETSLTGLDWAPIGRFEPVAAVAAKQLTLPNTIRFIRARWVLSGTSPSATFVVSGTAHQLYCLPSDVTRYGIPELALNGFPPASITDACLAASDEAAGYLASAYTLPMVKWDTDLRKHVACMAVYDILGARGYEPDSGKDTLIDDRRKQAIVWLNRIADGKLRPPGMVDSTPQITEPEVYVDSAASRGWRR
jgi:phage gp36-like protein